MRLSGSHRQRQAASGPSTKGIDRDRAGLADIDCDDVPVVEVLPVELGDELPVSQNCFSERIDLGSPALRGERPDESLSVLPHREVVERHNPHVGDAADLCDLIGRTADVRDDRYDLQIVAPTGRILRRRRPVATPKAKTPVAIRAESFMGNSLLVGSPLRGSSGRSPGDFTCYAARTGSLIEFDQCERQNWYRRAY